jgi:hypothetical protein
MYSAHIDDPSLNAADAARFSGISIPTMNRRIRNGQHPRQDYTVGQYRFWKLSTLVSARERCIGESAANAAAKRKAQLLRAAGAREGQGKNTAV